MVDMAVMLGAPKDRAETELKESLLFEIQLANVSVTGGRGAECAEDFERRSV